MTGEYVLVEDRGAYAVVTLNRPEKRNAISRALADDLLATLQRLEGHKVLVLTGAGKAFSAGVDLSERAERPGWSATLGVDGGQYWAQTLAAVHRHPAVVIAAVNGFALGGGLTLVNIAEIAIAASSAQFGMPEMSFGSFPALSGPSTVRRLLPKHAAHLMFTAQRIDAARALQWGLVSEVVADEELLTRAGELAEVISGYDGATLAFGKRAFAAMQTMGWTDAIDQGVLVSALTRNLSAEDR